MEYAMVPPANNAMGIIVSKEALKYIRMLIDKEKPDLLIGNSCGAFLA